MGRIRWNLEISQRLNSLVLKLYVPHVNILINKHIIRITELFIHSLNLKQEERELIHNLNVSNYFGWFHEATFGAGCSALTEWVDEESE